MKNKALRVWGNGKVWLFLALALFVILAIRIACQYRYDIKKAYDKLNAYNINTIDTEFGKMSYIVEGHGEAILISHGILGGYDQGYESLKSLTGDNCRIIAVSRFGYPGSEVPENPTPKNQAVVFLKILDELKIENAYILTTSAGCSAGYRFALDYPDRVKGRILLSSGAPDQPRSAEEIKELGMLGPPDILIHDFPMWFSMKYFGFAFERMTNSQVRGSFLYSTMLPADPRRQGAIVDRDITNIEMTLNYADYPVEEIKKPILIIHAKDDPMARYENIEKLLVRVDAETVFFETGGHIISGHEKEVSTAILSFIGAHKTD